MKTDYIDAIEPESSEADFVEKYWTKIWESEGNIKYGLDRVRRQDELSVMRKYMDPKVGQRILDAGCGLGDWVLFFEQEKHAVTGLDISRSTIHQLNDKFPDSSFQIGDVRGTHFPNETFDVSYSWGVFEHFEDGPSDCLREAFRILKPGGLLFASVPFDNWRISTKSTFAKPVDNYESQRFYQYRFSREEWARAMSKAGFHVEALVPIHKRQGVLRCLHHEFKLPFEWTLTRGLSVLLAPFIPGSWIAHMLLGVGRKPAIDA